MTRLEGLKNELAGIKYFQFLSFELKRKIIDYYEHEIECIEEYGSENPEVKE